MRAEITRLHVKQGSTTIYVTHDQVEAMSLADRIVIMHEGVLQQVGTPEEVYANPRNLFVAQFVGSPVMNIAAARISERDGGVRVHIDAEDEGFEFPGALLSQLNGHAAGKSLSFGIRPEGVLLSLEPRQGHVPMEAHIIEPLGSHDIVDLKVGDAMIRARTTSGFVPQAGTIVYARVDPTQSHFFDTASGMSLGVRL
jgi:multiple sugar transport system ATP-binding protein